MCKGRKKTIWTDEAIQYLQDYYAITPNPQLAKVLGTTKASVATMAAKLGLHKNNRSWKLTHKVKETIKNLYPTCSYKSIANKLGISANSVYLYIKELKKNDPSFRKRTKDEIGKLIGERRQNLLRRERALAAFGFEQRTNVKVHQSQRRSAMRLQLRRKGNYEIDYGATEVYILDPLKRNIELEYEASRIGFDFYLAVSEPDAEGYQTYQKTDINYTAI